MPRSVRKRKFIVYVAISADGFIARRDGSVDWLDRPRPKGNYGMGALYRSIDTCVLGRKTYDLSVSFGMAEGYAGKKNYVFSRTLSKAASPKVSIVSEDVHVFSERLRSEKGKDIWLVGGAELVAAFLDSGQVDEFIIHVIPKMIGEGIPLVAARHRNLGLKLRPKVSRMGWSNSTIPSEGNDPAAVAPTLSTVIDRELEEEVHDSSGSRIRCPLCGWSP